MSMLQPDEALYSLLCKYLLNEADEVERRWVETWRGESAANEEVLASIRKMLDVPALTIRYPGLDTESSWQRLRKGITEQGAVIRPMNAVVQQEDPHIVPMRPPAGRSRLAAIGIAAAVLIGLSIWFLAPPASPETFSGNQQAALEDGSQVIMEKNASMQLAKGFGKKERRVHFSGKAVFDIAQDAQAPFVVEMEKMEIKVLGTQFMVDFQPGSNDLLIHVTSGRILVINKTTGESVEMTRGMLFKHNAVAQHVKNINTRELVFNDIPLKEVLKTVEAVYDIKVYVADASLLDKKISTNFTNAPVETIMSTLTYMTNTQSEQTGPHAYTIQ